MALFNEKGTYPLSDSHLVLERKEIVSPTPPTSHFSIFPLLRRFSAHVKRETKILIVLNLSIVVCMVNVIIGVVVVVVVASAADADVLVIPVLPLYILLSFVFFNNV